jgi:hypothetical protein
MGEEDSVDKKGKEEVKSVAQVEGTPQDDNLIPIPTIEEEPAYIE